MKHRPWKTLLPWLVAAAPALGEVEFTVSNDPYFVGSPITLSIDIINEPDHQPPVVPDIEGAEVRLPPQPSRRSQISIVNGRQSVSESFKYQIEIIPRRAGALEIPSIEVVAGGKPWRTSPRRVQVNKSDAEDLLFVEVHADRDAVYLGESLEIRLEIWLRPMRQSGFGSENDMWQCIDLRRSAWGPFAALLQETRNVNVQKRVRPGKPHQYYVYSLSRTHWPERAGTLELGDISIAVEYPLQVARDNSVFSFFNEPRMLRSRPLNVPASVDNVTVKPIPTAGRPPGYSGAVGKYEFDVEARPTEVHVGDPITLTMSVRGSGRLDLLQPPRLDEIEALTRGFKLPSDSLAGTVEGSVKRFTQTLRARDASVTEIPPIPFSWFDPRAEKFVTAESDPIPIKVAETDRLSVSHSVEAETGRQVATRLTRRGDGILANYTDMNLLLADQRFNPGAGTAAMLAMPPVVFVATTMARRRRERLRRDGTFARRQRARAHALQTLSPGRSAVGSADEAATALAAVTGYVADRRGLPARALTRAETLTHLRDGGAPEEIIREIDALLADCEALRYAGGGAAASDSLTERARQCIEALARARL